MLEQIRAAVEAASGLVEVPRKRAEKIAQELARTSELRASQISKLAEDIVRRSRENAEMVRALVSSEVRRQVKALGLATRDDLDRLLRRVDRLEKRGAKRSAPGKKKPAKKKK